MIYVYARAFKSMEGFVVKGELFVPLSWWMKRE